MSKSKNASFIKEGIVQSIYQIYDSERVKDCTCFIKHNDCPCMFKYMALIDNKHYNISKYMSQILNINERISFTVEYTTITGLGLSQ